MQRSTCSTPSGAKVEQVEQSEHPSPHPPPTFLMGCGGWWSTGGRALQIAPLRVEQIGGGIEMVKLSERLLDPDQDIHIEMALRQLGVEVYAEAGDKLRQIRELLDFLKNLEKWAAEKVRREENRLVLVKEEPNG